MGLFQDKERYARDSGRDAKVKNEIFCWLCDAEYIRILKIIEFQTPDLGMGFVIISKKVWFGDSSVVLDGDIDLYWGKFYDEKTCR